MTTRTTATDLSGEPFSQAVTVAVARRKMAENMDKIRALQEENEWYGAIITLIKVPAAEASE